MRLTSALIAVLVGISCFRSSPTLADSFGKFPGKGSLEAYNRSCRPLNKALQLDSSGDVAGAIRLTREAIAIYPYDSASHQNLGEFLEKTGKIEEAIKEHLQAVSLEPKMLGAWLSLGNEYELQKKFEDAERCYRRSVEIKDSSYEALCDLGDILRKQGKFEESRKWLLRAMKSPGYATARPGEIQRKLRQCDRKDTSD
ncbi:MAG: tetratricopeptide repeat protein [Candidatus Obscuribacterales bacterium]|nr:tetratricopeptide repeat protein [Candidatus Obscuribacterales bacterium]